MNLSEAIQIYETLSTSRYELLFKTMLKKAVRYSRLRVDWYLSGLEEKIEIDKERTLAHNAFIDSCNILSRNMGLAGEDVQWRHKIGEDRKELGDFACLLHAVLGIKAR